LSIISSQHLRTFTFTYIHILSAEFLLLSATQLFNRSPSPNDTILINHIQKF